MEIALLIITGLCMLGVVHTYILYPMMLVGGDKNPRDESPSMASTPSTAPASAPKYDVWPSVTVLMAAHNEEAVIGKKLDSLFASNYPGALRFLVGSDNSSDGTNQLLSDYAAGDSRLKPRFFTSRQGKPGIINQMAASAGREGILILTDASVMLQADTITELVRPMLKDGRIGVVDSLMIQTGGRATGIGASEETYINREVALKVAQGEKGGVMMGPFGGCFALRAAAFRPVPDNFLVDDFYLCMSAYEQGYRGVVAPQAKVYEAVGQEIREEFRRKVRIGSGNWQNLFRFRRLWFAPWKNRLAYTFYSHKVLRWWTPILSLIAVVCLFFSWQFYGNYWAGVLLALLSVGAVVSYLADVLLAGLGINLRPLRNLRYFLAMNAALLVGFIRFLTGIKSNVWQPSTRH